MWIDSSLSKPKEQSELYVGKHVKVFLETHQAQYFGLENGLSFDFVVRNSTSRNSGRVC